MALEDYKINSSEYANADVKALPDIPAQAGYTAQTLKARFDNVPENIIIPKYNNLIEALIDNDSEYRELLNYMQYNLVQITLTKSNWGAGQKYIKQGTGNQITDMDADSICEPILTESNIATLVAAGKHPVFQIEPTNDKFLFFLQDTGSPTNPTKPENMTFYCRIWNPPSKRV